MGKLTDSVLSVDIGKSKSVLIDLQVKGQSSHMIIVCTF